MSQELSVSGNTLVVEEWKLLVSLARPANILTAHLTQHGANSDGFLSIGTD